MQGSARPKIFSHGRAHGNVHDGRGFGSALLVLETGIESRWWIRNRRKAISVVGSATGSGLAFGRRQTQRRDPASEPFPSRLPAWRAPDRLCLSWEELASCTKAKSRMYKTSSPLRLFQWVWGLRAELRPQFRVEELLGPRRPWNIWALLRRGFAFIRVVAFCGCQY